MSCADWRTSPAGGMETDAVAYLSALECSPRIRVRQRAAGAIRTRCDWPDVIGNPLYLDYHDNEWGVPVHDDRALFELLVLQSAQAGLTWSTILHKRHCYRRAFEYFDPERVARFSKARQDQLLRDPGIVRNRLKIASAVTNAQKFLDLKEGSGSFSNWLWQFVDGTPIQNAYRSWSDVPASTPLSDVISKEMKKRGFSFVGSTTVYAYLQAAGVVNDHQLTCFRHQQIARLK